MAPDSAREALEIRNAPQFRLRSLFLLIALLAVLFAVMGSIGPIASAALLLFLTMVGLHVAGNALGTTLRDRVSDQVRWKDERAVSSGLNPAQLQSSQYKSRLSEYTPLGWISRTFGVVGALTGGTLGGLAFGQLTDSPSQLAVGVLSFAVLGAFIGFLGGSFLAMTLRAWNQAARDPLKADVEAG